MLYTIVILAAAANALLAWAIGIADMLPRYAEALALSQTPAAHAAPDASAPVALFPVLQHGKFGYIDRTGRIAVTPQFQTADRFSDGLALVEVGGSQAYINTTGSVVIMLDHKEFNPAFPFSEGMAVVGKRGPGDFIQDLLGYIDKTGTFMIEPTFGMAQSFSNGLARVGAIVSGLPRECYVDMTGKRTLRQEFRLIDDFSEGLAAVWVGDRIGFIKQEKSLQKVGKSMSVQIPKRLSRSQRYSLSCGKWTFTIRWSFLERNLRV